MTADPVTIEAYEALDAASHRSIFVRCPACDDYVEDAWAEKHRHAQTCAPLRATCARPVRGGGA